MPPQAVNNEFVLVEVMVSGCAIGVYVCRDQHEDATHSHSLLSCSILNIFRQHADIGKVIRIPEASIHLLV